MMKKQKLHWENVYSTKQPQEVSWTQTIPKTSLDFLHKANLKKSAQIVDIGGGDSTFVDFLLEEGYQNITVLDISEHALNKAKSRLGEKSASVKWVVSDITQFEPEQKYDFWHDRATFHFLTKPAQIVKYLGTAKNAMNENGVVTIGTFSENGPKKCSGLDIKQYSEATLSKELQKGFDKIKCIIEDHITPFNTIQNFIFCSFKKKSAVNQRK